MSKYHDDSTAASNPGCARLSDAKLREIEPSLFEPRTFKCGPLCEVDHPAAEMRERIAEHLELGDSRAAVVVSTRPLVVAAYSDDLDAAALLWFPPTFVSKYQLAVGSRLLTVNTYGDVRGDGGVPFYAVDLVPGPQRRAWSNFSPLIADFLSDDLDRIEARKRSIDEAEWQRLRVLADQRVRSMGLDTARPGKPTLAGTPVQVGGDAYFRPMGGTTSWIRVVGMTVAALWLVMLLLRVLGR